MSAGIIKPWCKLSASEFPLMTMEIFNMVAINRRFQCPVLVKTTYKEIIPSSSVKQRVHLVHDFLSGECGFEESNHDVVEEREVIQHYSLTTTHNLTNNRYPNLVPRAFI
jgi:hypothetical protein